MCRYMSEDVGLLLVRVWRCRVSIGTCSLMSALCLDLFGEVGLGSGHVRCGRFSVGTCSAKSC